MQSAYIVFLLSRTNQTTSDTPWLNTSLGGGSGRLTTLDINIEQWPFTAALPNPTRGVWAPTTTYATGDTVASNLYSIQTVGGTVIAPLTYRSLHPSNLNHQPDKFDGWWTCISQPPGASQAINYASCPFAYVLSPLPTAAGLGATTWGGQLWHSLSWNAPSGP